MVSILLVCRAIFSQGNELLRERQSPEPHGLLSLKVRLCIYGYTILKNALKEGLLPDGFGHAAGSMGRGE